ncbi:MAG: hypothetical protein CBC73_03105 [Flavobacteriales bacterium TMED113]|nr:MAG: hypothetical protein CBC73_03105 [Flavobacteriales bacterium TMED113]|tara:strand:- start:531 stop:812 length:282 start_codon:yes stop_codon:yes gene_type:complete
MSYNKIKKGYNKQISEEVNNNTNETGLIFKRKNYIILIVGILTLISGFILLSGGGTDDYEYNKSIFNFQRQVLAPIIIIISLIICGVSITLKK